MVKTDFSKSLTENIINSSIDGILAYDLDYRYTIWNPAMERITGLSASHCLGRRTYEVFPFLVETGEHKFFSESLQGKSVLSIDRQYTVPETNKVGHFEAIYSPLYGDQGQIIGGFSLVRETSEWKRTYRALRESELRLSHVTSVASDAIITCNRQGNILSWNKSAETLFRWTASQVTGKNLSEFLPAYDWSAEFSSSRSTDAVAGFFGKRQDESNMPVAISASRWNLGGDAFLSLAVKDLSDITHLENQAAEQRELAEALMQAQNELNQGVAVVDTLTDKPIFLNQAFANMTGYSREELFKFSDMSKIVAPEEVPLMKKRIEMRLKTQKSNDFYELTMIHKDGFRINVEIAAKQLETSFGITSFNLIRDITARKSSEALLRQSETFFKMMTESAQSVLLRLSGTGEIISANPAFKSLLGFEPKEWTGENFMSLVMPEDQDKVKDVSQHFNDLSFYAETHLQYLNSSGVVHTYATSFYVAAERESESNVMVLIRPPRQVPGPA